MANLPPPPSAPPRRKRQEKVEAAEVSFSSQPLASGSKIGVYGPGGEGKTTLCAGISQVGIKPVLIDLDKGSSGLTEIARAMNSDGSLCSTFSEVRAALQSPAILEFDCVIIDTLSALEERAREHVIATVPHEKSGRPINSLEDYGFGKGYVHLYEQMLLILSDLDALVEKGKHIILICHQVAERAPSATSEDYLEYQPRLQSPPKTGKVRERVFEFCDHFFRLDQDRVVTDGKAMNTDSRAIYTTRSATSWAKHRALPNGREIPDVIPFPKGSVEIWKLLFGN